MARIKPQALLQQSKKKKGPSRISFPTIALYVLVVVVMVFFLLATYRHWSRRYAGDLILDSSYGSNGSSSRSSSAHRSMIQTEDSLSTIEGDSVMAIPRISDIPKYAVISTSKGSITVELFKEGSPEVVDEFIESCKKGRFKGMLFNRVIKNFIVQGGDVERHGATEDWTARGKHYSQLDTSLKHEAFMLGTSKARHEGGGFDLIITTAPIPDLNQKINVFGRVIKGEDVVQEIEEADTDEHYRPKTAIEITEVILKQKR